MKNAILKDFTSVMTEFGGKRQKDNRAGQKSGGYFEYPFTFADGSSLLMYRAGAVVGADGLSRWPRPVDGVTTLEVGIRFQPDVVGVTSMAAKAFNDLAKYFKVKVETKSLGQFIRLIGTASMQVCVAVKGA